LGENILGKFLMNHPISAVHGVFEEKLYPHRVQFESSESYQFYATDNRDHLAGFLMNVNNAGGPLPVDFVRPARLWGDELAQHVNERFGPAA
jgi:hypothetical protein